MPAGSGFTNPTRVQYTAQEYADASMLDAFKMKVREWHSRYLHLQSMRVPDSLKSEQARLLSLGSAVKDAIQKVTGTLDAFGLSAVPLVAAGVVAAALAAIAWWNNSYNSFATKARKAIYDEKYHEFIATGASPEQANALAIQAANSLVTEEQTGPLALLLRNWQLVAVGVGAFLLYRMMKK